MFGFYFYFIGCLISITMSLILARGYQKTEPFNIDDLPAMVSFMGIMSWIAVFLILKNKTYREILIKGLKK